MENECPIIPIHVATQSKKEEFNEHGEKDWNAVITNPDDDDLDQMTGLCMHPELKMIL